MLQKHKTYSLLDRLISQSGLKYNYIADEMGISRAQLYKMRVNPIVMGIDHMESLARILGCSFSDIYSVRKKFRKEVDKNATRNKKMTSVLWTSSSQVPKR